MHVKFIITKYIIFNFCHRKENIQEYYILKERLLFASGKFVGINDISLIFIVF